MGLIFFVSKNVPTVPIKATMWAKLSLLYEDDFIHENAIHILFVQRYN